jgi:hypothetical protein
MAQKLAMITRGKQGPTTEEICYLAGIIDGEGCISIAKMDAGVQRTKNPRYVLTVNVTNTSEELVKWLVEKFGGHYKNRTGLPENYRQSYDWWYNNGKALWLLELVRPYLIIKGAQADTGIELIRDWKTPRGGQGARTDPAEVERRERVYQKMLSVKASGFRAAATTECSGSRVA